MRLPECRQPLDQRLNARESSRIPFLLREGGDHACQSPGRARRVAFVAERRVLEEVQDGLAQRRVLDLAVGAPGHSQDLGRPRGVREVGGAAPVGLGTRVPLDSVAWAFGNGCTAEEIVQQFSSLALADVYTAISFILNNPEMVENYCNERESQRSSTKTANESRFDPSGIRSRLMNRRNQG